MISIEPVKTATEWLCRQLPLPNPTVPEQHELTAVYKAPIALKLVGRMDDLEVVGQYIQNRFVRAGRVLDPDLSQEYLQHAPSYRSAWLALAFDHLRPPLYADRTPPSSCGILTAACAGIVASADGRPQQVLAAAQRLIELLKLSSGSADVIHIDEASDGGASVRWARITHNTPQPKTYIPCLGIVCLVLAYRHTNDRQYLHAAQQYWQLLSGLGLDLFTGDYVGKIGLAASSLFWATGQPRYKDAARTSVAVLNSWLSPEGGVLLRHKFPDLSAQPRWVTMDRTSEYIVAVTAITRILEAA